MKSPDFPFFPKPLVPAPSVSESRIKRIKRIQRINFAGSPVDASGFDAMI